MPSTTKTETGVCYAKNSRTGSKHANTSELVVRQYTKTSVKTPNYMHLRTIGSALPDNPFYYSATERHPTWGTAKGSDGDVWIFGPYAASTIYKPNFAIDAGSLNGKLIDRAKGQQWNAPIFFAEANKTAKMVAATATNLVMMVRDLRRGDLGAFARRFHASARHRLPNGRAVTRFNRNFGRDARKAAANALLEYRYGWTPFMKDVQDLTNTLLDLADKPFAMTTKVKAKKVANQIKTVIGPELMFADVSTPSGARVYGTIIRLADETARAEWRFRPNSLDLPARFGLVNPLEVAWELVPLSFVADWFLPIGSYLASLDVPMRFSHIGGSYGNRMVATSTSSASSGHLSGFAGTSTFVAVNRAVMSSAPSLTLRGKFNSDVGKSLSHVTSSLALLTQQLSRLERR